jgi:hypothetical protein
MGATYAPLTDAIFCARGMLFIPHCLLLTTGEHRRGGVVVERTPTFKPAVLGGRRRRCIWTPGQRRSRPWFMSFCNSGLGRKVPVKAAAVDRYAQRNSPRCRGLPHLHPSLHSLSSCCLTPLVNPTPFHCPLKVYHRRLYQLILPHLVTLFQTSLSFSFLNPLKQDVKTENSQVHSPLFI